MPPPPQFIPGQPVASPQLRCALAAETALDDRHGHGVCGELSWTYAGHVYTLGRVPTAEALAEIDLPEPVILHQPRGEG